jgi:hypothetical protein
MSFILRRCSDVDPYACITYDYYMQMAAAGTYNVDKYMEEISRLFHHSYPHNVNLNQERVYTVETDLTYSHANFIGQIQN